MEQHPSLSCDELIKEIKLLSGCPDSNAFSWARNNTLFSITYLRFVSEFITIFCKSIAGNTSVCTLSLGLNLHLLRRMCWSENFILESSFCFENNHSPKPEKPHLHPG